jgi:hypothetical protein
MHKYLALLIPALMATEFPLDERATGVILASKNNQVDDLSLRSYFGNPGAMSPPSWGLRRCSRRRGIDGCDNLAAAMTAIPNPSSRFLMAHLPVWSN